MKIKIIRIDKSLPLPEYHTTGSAAFDLYSRIEMELKPGQIGRAPANMIIKVPKGRVLLIAARSSLSKRGLALANGIGVIDRDFCGPEDEINITLRNFSDKPVKIEKGERIAQGLIVPVETAVWEEKKALAKKSRGGFGSTGYFIK